MSKSQYPYPPDEFDVRVGDDAPVGVHRAPRSGWSSVWPFVLVAVVFAAIAIGAVSLLSGDPGTPAAEQTTTAPADPSAEASDDASAPEESEPAEPAPSESAPTEEPTEEPSDEPVADADLELPVRVLNGSGASGVAGAAAEQLTEAGFADVTPDNYTQDPLPSDVVWYQAEEYAPTAQEVARVLGIEEVRLVEGLRGAVTAIIMTAPEA